MIIIPVWLAFVCAAALWVTMILSRTIGEKVWKKINLDATTSPINWDLFLDRAGTLIMFVSVLWAWSSIYH